MLNKHVFKTIKEAFAASFFECYISSRKEGNMLNQVVLVGRLVRDPELRKTSTNKNMSYVTLAIPRSFKNSEGEYETDFVDCTLWEAVAKSTVEYCKKGDIVGVKGRIASRVIEEDEKNKTVLEVIAEKVTFLSNSNKDK